MRVLHILFHPDTVIVTDGGPPAFARRQKKCKISTCTALVPVHRSKSYTAGTMCLRSALLQPNLSLRYVRGLLTRKMPEEDQERKLNETDVKKKGSVAFSLSTLPNMMCCVRFQGT